MRKLLAREARDSYVSREHPGTPDAWIDALVGVAPSAGVGDLTVRDACGLYLDAIESRGSYRAARSRIDCHVLTDHKIADLPIARLTRRGFRDFIRDLKVRAPHLRPKSIANIASDLRSVFADLVDDALLPANPCSVRSGDLEEPDHRWRADARLYLEEACRLISDVRIPLGRRVLYAVLLLGLRPGEAFALLLSDLTRTTRPLWVIEVTKSWDTHAAVLRTTKTGAHRRHPVLVACAELLTEWLDGGGWSAQQGRDPKPGDVLLPCRQRGPGRKRGRVVEPRRWRTDTLRKVFLRDLVLIGVARAMSTKDLRRSARSLALEAGVPVEYRNRVTHARPKDAALYDEVEMSLLSTAYLPIALSYRRTGEQLRLPGVLA